MCRLCGEAEPRIIITRLMVSLPVHVSCFDLNIVYTNMSGVTGGESMLATHSQAAEEPASGLSSLHSPTVAVAGGPGLVGGVR